MGDVLSRQKMLSTLLYEPRFSVAWNGDALKYYVHKDDPEFHPRGQLILQLLPEWSKIWGCFWLRFVVRYPYAIVKKLWRKARVKRAEA
jgi:hypothetical protein